jgi:hypothetical protein
LGVLAEVACTRHEVEEYFEDAKSYLGMAQDETRSWVGWHHPDATRSQKETLELTRDRTVRLLQRAMEVPGLTLRLALVLVEYHLRRNEVARRSHA